jgi:hypothetical protein
MRSALNEAEKIRKKSKNTIKTWVMIRGTGGIEEPHNFYIIKKELKDKSEDIAMLAKISCDDVIYEGRIMLIDGTFPDWRKVLNVKSNNTPSRLNNKYVSIISKIAGSPITIIQSSHSVNLVISEDHNFICGLMPMHVNNQCYDISWTNPKGGQ